MEADVGGPSDEALLRAYAGGDDAAFEALLERYGGRVFNFLCRMLGQGPRAEDVYQAVCIKIAQKAGQFGGEHSARAWIFRIARNAAVDSLRHEARRPTVSLERPAGDPGGPRRLDTLADGGADPAAEAVRRELAESVRKALESLPDEQREAFLLKEEGGLTFREAGELLGCGKETAKSRVRYAIERLRNALGKEARQHGLQ